MKAWFCRFSCSRRSAISWVTSAPAAVSSPSGMTTQDPEVREYLVLGTPGQKAPMAKVPPGSTGVRSFCVDVLDAWKALSTRGRLAMRSHFVNDFRHWQDRAEEMRKLADGMADEQSEQTML